MRLKRVQLLSSSPFLYTTMPVTAVNITCDTITDMGIHWLASAAMVPALSQLVIWVYQTNIFREMLLLCMDYLVKCSQAPCWGAVMILVLQLEKLRLGIILFYLCSCIWRWWWWHLISGVHSPPIHPPPPPPMQPYWKSYIPYLFTASMCDSARETGAHP